MPKLIIATKMLNGAPVPPSSEMKGGGPQLHYDFVKGIPQAGGHSVIGPGEGKTVIVMVDAPNETVAAMRSDARYLPLDTADKSKAAAWLAANTDAKSVALSKEILSPVLTVHGLDKAAYEKLIDTPWAREDAVSVRGVEK